MNDQAAELSTATGAADASSVTLGKREYTIRPLRIGQMGPVLRALKPVLPILQKLFNDGEAEIELDELDESQVTAMIDMAAAAVCKSIDDEDELRQIREEVAQLDLEEFSVLVMQVLQVNMDFFSKRLAPRLRSMAGDLQTAIATTAGAGATASST